MIFEQTCYIAILLVKFFLESIFHEDGLNSFLLPIDAININLNVLRKYVSTLVSVLSVYISNILNLFYFMNYAFY